jgi:hypothetical protein
MKPGVRPSISPRPVKPAKRKRSQPLPDWLAAVVFLGGLLIVGAIFAFRYYHAGYEGADKYHEFRGLKKEYLAIKAAEAEKAKAAEGQAVSSSLSPDVAASLGQSGATDLNQKAMLDWFNSLPSEQRATLEKKGNLRFPFAELKKTDPERAEFLKQYVASETGGSPTQVFPTTVNIDKVGSGQYNMGVETNTGTYVCEQIFPGRK